MTSTIGGVRGGPAARYCAGEDVVLTTAGIPVGKRLPFWREYVCRTIAGVEARGLGDASAYAGSIPTRPILIPDRPGFDLLLVTADPQRVDRTRELINVQTEDSWLLMIQGPGTCAVRQGAQQATLVAGDIAFLDTSRPYEVIFPQAFKQYIVKAPPALLRNILPMRRDVAGLMLPGGDPLVAIARHNLLLLDRLAHTINPALLPTAAEHAIDHLALAMRSLLDTGATRRSR